MSVNTAKKQHVGLSVTLPKLPTDFSSILQIFMQDTNILIPMMKSVAFIQENKRLMKQKCGKFHQLMP